MLTIAAIVVVAVLGFLLPRASWWPQEAADKSASGGRQARSKMPT